MPSSDNTEALISVAIATYNRADTLSRALECVTKLKSEGFDIEAVVIDNGSSDHTRQVVEAAAQRCPFSLRYYYEAQPGLPFARNRAVAESLGQWIAFFDDDQLTQPDWLGTLYRTALREGVLCVGGSRTLLIESEKTAKMTDYCRELLGEVRQVEPSQYHALNLPCTGNVLIHRSLFERWGVFDEKAVDGGEDSDFFNRIILNGVRCIYEPSASVQHIIPESRLTREYLELIAFRHGRHVCRRDLRHRGRGFTFLSALARLLLVGFSTRSKMAVAWLAAQPDEFISQSCKWRRACGYLSFALQHSKNQAQLTAQTMHRGR